MGRSSHAGFVALVLGAFLLVAACSDDSTSNASSATTAPPAAVTTTNVASGSSEGSESGRATTAPPATTTTAPAGAVIEITVANGKVDGGGRKQVKKGESLTVRVTSDVADEVHVHGYDLKVDLEPGVPGELTFTPDAAGVFEVELEHKGQKLAELEVR
jgi:hypothetical protein